MAKREDLEFQEVSQSVKYPRQLDTPETTIRTSAIAAHRPEVGADAEGFGSGDLPEDAQ